MYIASIEEVRWTLSMRYRSLHSSVFYSEGFLIFIPYSHKRLRPCRYSVYVVYIYIYKTRCVVVTFCVFCAARVSNIGPRSGFCHYDYLHGGTTMLVLKSKNSLISAAHFRLSVYGSIQSEFCFRGRQTQTRNVCHLNRWTTCPATIYGCLFLISN